MQTSMHTPTMRLRNVTALCVVLFASVAGCHPAVAPRGSDDEKAAACREHLRAASDPMSTAIAGHQDCATDADCVLVPFGAACFDACTRVMSRTGAAAYEKARGDTATPCAELA